MATTIGPELDNLADNIGLGRMWAGVHWRSDHTAGLKLGRTVAQLVLEQLFATGDLMLCIQQPNQGPQCRPFPLPLRCDEPLPPSILELETQRDAFMAPCGNPTLQTPCNPPSGGFRPPLTDVEITAEVRRFEAELRLSGAARADAELQRVGAVLSRLVDEDQALVDASRSVQQGADPQPDTTGPRVDPTRPERQDDVQQ